ncbi:MAG TPA: enoyl-CoA hydratase [Thermoanaerobaculia bacterium]|nr:enoyl-CoA hydratase [Thermoanaerobaculia bacterium]
MSADPKTSAAAPLVLRDDSGGVVRLTLNRPDRFNPLSLEMIAALEQSLDAAAADPAARVVVLGAGGRGFSAGHDLKQMRAHMGDEAWQRRLFEDCSRMMVKLTKMPQPVIARVHGIATAAGCQLVSMCDLAVASDTATFALPGVNVGIFCTTPAVGVARNVARKRVMEMLLTGRPIDAPTALAWGLVNRVVPAADLDAAVQDFVEAILSKSPAVIGAGKRAFYEQIDRSLGGAYEIAGPAMSRGALLEDATEGIDAFLQKRPAQWRGR